MNEQTTKLIEQLANKLGTTTEYLWNVLLTQAPIAATSTLIQVLLVAIGVSMFVKLHIRFSKKKTIESDYRTYDSTEYEESEYLQVIMGVFGFILAFLLICCFFFIDEIVKGYFNPEYWALESVLSTLKQD